MVNPDELKEKAADLVKKVVGVGIGAIFLTEESLRGVISELKIPKELLGSILESASKTRAEFLGKLSSEVLDRVMNKVDIKALVEDYLAKHEVKLDVKVTFEPRGNVEPKSSGQSGL